VKWVAVLIFLPCIVGAIWLGLFRIIPIELWAGAVLSLAVAVFVAREERKNPNFRDGSGD
jgi:hypothetical protein